MENNELTGKHIGTFEIEVPVPPLEQLEEKISEMLNGMAIRLGSAIESYRANEEGDILAITEMKASSGGSLTGCCFLQQESECFTNFQGEEGVLFVDENGDFASISQDGKIAMKTIYRKRARRTSKRSFKKLFDRINAGIATRKEIERATVSMGCKVGNQ